MTEDEGVRDPDVDLGSPRDRAELRPAVLAAIAAGGALGGLARHGLVSLAPGAVASAWTVLAVNASGALLIGVLMAVLTTVPGLPPLTRPFLGVGVLGGYTTFSTYVADVLHLGGTLAVVHLLLTPLTALAAVTVGVTLTRAVLRR